jgi:hypothetical protein
MLNVECWMFLLLAALPFSLSAQSTNNLLPPLAPAYGELQSSFWERHGNKILIGGFEYLVLAAVLAWIIFRPRPPMIVPPIVQARESLTKLLSQPENGKVLSEVSQILQHYICAAFKFPWGEMTTGEFSTALAANQQVGPELAQSVSGFLRECDERKFSTRNSSAPLNAASRALELVGQTESRIKQTAVVTLKES